MLITWRNSFEAQTSEHIESADIEEYRDDGDEDDKEELFEKEENVERVRTSHRKLIDLHNRIRLLGGDAAKVSFAVAFIDKVFVPGQRKMSWKEEHDW